MNLHWAVDSVICLPQVKKQLQAFDLHWHLVAGFATTMLDLRIVSWKGNTWTAVSL